MPPNFTPPQPHILPFRAFHAAHFEKDARDRWLQTIFNPAAPHFGPPPFNTIPGVPPWPSAYNMPTPTPFGYGAYQPPPSAPFPPQRRPSYAGPESHIYVSGLGDEERYDERQGVFEEQLHAHGTRNQGYVQPLQDGEQEGEYGDEGGEYEYEGDEYDDDEDEYEDEGGEYGGDDNNDDDEEEGHVHFELTEEAIAMFAFSEARRQERLAQRALEAESTEHASTSIMDAEPLATALLRHHPRGGAASNAVIEAMESTLDAYYERSCADGQVVLWPVLPLRL